MDHRPVARRRAAVGAGPPAQGALSDLSRGRRHAAGLRALEPVLDAGARSGAGAVRRTRAAGCRLRHLGARPPAKLAAGLDPGVRRGRADHRRGRGAGACADAGHAMGRRDRARRHRGAAGCRGGNRDPASGQAALSHSQDSRRRKPAQRRQRAADLPRRGRRRRGPAFQVERVCALDRGGAGGKRGGRLSVRPAVDAADPAHSGRTERDHRAVRRHLHGVDRGRACRPLRHPHHRGLCDHAGAHHAGADPGAAAGADLCGVGNRGVRSQRAGVHADRLAVASDLGAARRSRALAILRGRRRRARRRHPDPYRLGDVVQHGGAVPDRARRGSPEPADGRADAARRHRGLLVRHARHRHAGGGLCAAGSLPLPRPHPADGVRRGAGIAADPGPDIAAPDRGAGAEGRRPGGP